MYFRRFLLCGPGLQSKKQQTNNVDENDYYYNKNSVEWP